MNALITLYTCSTERIVYEYSTHGRLKVARNRSMSQSMQESRMKARRDSRTTRGGCSRKISLFTGCLEANTTSHEKAFILCNATRPVIVGCDFFFSLCMSYSIDRTRESHVPLIDTITYPTNKSNGTQLKVHREPRPRRAPEGWSS